jgi:hypothetical protein
MGAGQSSGTIQGSIAALILMLTGIILIRTGRTALRDPSHTRVWTDLTGLWLTERPWGRTAAEELERRLREISRIRRVGKQGVGLGVVFLIAAIVELIVLVL